LLLTRLGAASLSALELLKERPELIRDARWKPAARLPALLAFGLSLAVRACFLLAWLALLSGLTLLALLARRRVLLRGAAFQRPTGNSPNGVLDTLKARLECVGETGEHLTELRSAPALELFGDTAKQVHDRLQKVGHAVQKAADAFVEDTALTTLLSALTGLAFLTILARLLSASKQPAGDAFQRLREASQEPTLLALAPLVAATAPEQTTGNTLHRLRETPKKATALLSS